MDPSTLLDHARNALRRADAPAAEALYRQCLQRGLAVHAEYAGLFYARGDLSSARAVLDEGIAAHPGDANLHFLRGLAAHAAAAHRDALSDFDAALALAPALVAARVNRALALLALERIPEAVAEMEQACLLAPGDAAAWTQLGLLRLRQEEWELATQALQTAEHLAPGRPVVLRSLASALAATGRAVEALPLLQQVEQLAPRDPAVLTDHALALLRCGRYDAAAARCDRALAMAPGDQTALAIRYLLHLECGELAPARRLMDYDLLLGRDSPEEVDAAGRAGLLGAVLAHPDLVWEPAGRSTLGGQQTARLDLSDRSVFAGFGRMVARAVQARMEHLHADPSLADHPWIRGLPAHWRLQAWATVLHRDGRQRPHIHPAGCMSGVFYLDVGAPVSPAHGCIVFGHPQDDLGLGPPPFEHVHRPAAGELLLFPSYFLHHTTPFEGARPRVSLAFDVLPG